MLSCAKTVGKARISLGQMDFLYPLSTDLPKYLTSQGFSIPSKSTSLAPPFTHRFTKLTSVNLNCSQFTQDLCLLIRINLFNTLVSTLRVGCLQKASQKGTYL